MAHNLQGFLSKFNTPNPNYAETIDPLSTFTVKMAFRPFLKKGKKDPKPHVDSSSNSQGQNLIANLTGGLLGGSESSETSVKDEMKKFKKKVGKVTNLAYIAKGNGFIKDDAGAYLVMDLSYYIQSVQIPQIENRSEGTSDTMFGQFPIPGKLVKPSANQFSMEVITTKAPLLERVFYPWMREVTMPFWLYNDQPYTTADITVSFNSHMDLKYMFVGCRPTQINSMTPTNESQPNPVRQVTFDFNYMYVLSKLPYMEDNPEKGLINGIGGGLKNMVGL